MRHRLLTFLATGYLVAVSAPAAITYTVTPGSSWGASAASLGLTGASVFGFETTQLPSDLSIRFTRGDNGTVAYDTGFGGSLPFVFDSTLDDFGTAFQWASPGDTSNPTAHAWDGTRSLVNVPTLPITTYDSTFGWGVIRISFLNPVTLVGFSLQQVDRAIGVEMATNGGTVSSDLTVHGITQDGYRNGYVKIEATGGTTISSIDIVGDFGRTFREDGFAMDYLAYGSNVPEPATGMLLLGGMLACAIRRRWKPGL